MSEAPERIWLYVDTDDQGERYLELISPDAECSTDVEYRRADLPPTLSAALALPEIAALVEAVDKLGLRKLVADWNGENRDTPYAPHPGHLRAKINTTCGVVYEIDAALRAAREKE